MPPMLRADLHCHSRVSDGLLTPTELVLHAASREVDMLALTDHDDVAGVAEASRAAIEAGVTFVPGVEISVSWGEHSLHIVGLGVDPLNPALLAGLQSIRDGRQGRAERMALELEKIGIHGALEGATRFAAGSSIIGRTHFARFLVEQGLAADVKSVFDHYLARDKVGYVPHHWVGLDLAIAWIRGAGGIAVIAHPARYRISSNERRRFYEAFQALGGEAIEVVSGAAHPNEQRDAANTARRFGFLASCGSDFHATGESHIDVGAIPPLPDDLVPVWERLSCLAR